MKYIFTSILFFTFSSLSAQIIPFENVDFKDTGFENVGTNCVFEDKDGFLWIVGFNHGLIRYDGKNIENIYEFNDFPSVINDIYQDEYGYLWVTGQDDRLTVPVLYVSARPVSADYISDTLLFKNEHLNIQLLGAMKSASKFSVSKDGKILVCADSVLVQYYYSSPKKLHADTIYIVNNSPSKSKLVSALYLPDGSITFNTIDDQYILLTNNNGNLSSPQIFEIDKIGVYNLGLADQKGGLWVVANDALNYIPDASHPRLNDSLLLPIQGPFEDIISLDENTLMLASKGNGLFEIDLKKNNTIKRYDTENGIINSGIFGINVGKENIWLACTIGVVRLPKDYRAFKAYTTDIMINGKPFLPQNGVNATTSKIKLKGDSREYNAACTNGGVVLFNDEGDYQLLDANNALNSSVILGIQADSKGRIWISGAGRGINCIHPKGEQLANFKNSRDIDLFGNAYTSSFMAADFFFFPDFITINETDPAVPTKELLCGASEDYLQILMDNDPLLWIGKESGYKSNSGINLITQDAAGYVYVGTSQGLFKTIQPFTRAFYNQIKNSGKVKKRGQIILTTEKILEPVPLAWKDSAFIQVNTLMVHNDHLWLGVATGTLILSTTDLKAVAFIPAPDIQNRPIPGSFCYNAGSIWTGTNEGIFEFDVHNFQQKQSVRVEHGLHNDASWGPKSLSVDSKGVFNYGTPKGLVRYKPYLDSPDTSIIPVVIRDYAFEDNGWGKNELNFNYIALTYDDPKKMRYRTRLKGYDEDWSAPSDKTEIRYTNLSATLFPKTYEFEVMSADYRNQWHQIQQSFPITVNPPLWSRWWSFLIYIAVIILIARRFFKWRIEEHKRKIALEEAKIIKEQKEIIEKKNRENEILLKEIHHRVKNNLQTISSLLSLQSQNITDPTALDAVQESKNRVASMALIHQKLYQGENLAAVEMKDYFKTIGETLIDSFGTTANNVELSVEMEEIELDVDTAIPIGLITNELMTNSLKYAFKKKQGGKVSIKMEKGENNSIHLKIADDGIFENQADDSENHNGFGTLLVQLLITQLGGEMEKSTTNGTVTQIHFPLRETVAA